MAYDGLIRQKSHHEDKGGLYQKNDYESIMFLSYYNKKIQMLDN